MTDMMGGFGEFFTNLFDPSYWNQPQQSGGGPDYADKVFADYPKGTNPWNNWDPSSEEFWAQVRANQASAPALDVNRSSTRMVGPRPVAARVDPTQPPLPRPPMGDPSAPGDTQAPTARPPMGEPSKSLGPADTARVTSALPSGSIAADANAATTSTFGLPGSNLARIVSKSGVALTVNSKVAGNFAGFVEELEGMGYKIDQDQSGGFNDRNSRGTNTKSQHAYGNAVDINWNHNTYKGGGVNNLPKNVAEIAAKYGLTWGGNWKNKDTMHFEWHPVHGVAARGLK